MPNIRPFGSHLSVGDGKFSIFKFEIWFPQCKNARLYCSGGTPERLPNGLKFGMYSPFGLKNLGLGHLKIFGWPNGHDSKHTSLTHLNPRLAPSGLNSLMYLSWRPCPPASASTVLRNSSSDIGACDGWPPLSWPYNKNTCAHEWKLKHNFLLLTV